MQRKLLAGTAVAALVAGAAGSATATAPAAAPAASGEQRSVIVQSTTDAAAAAAAVRRAGGKVTAALPIVDGVAATVPAAAVSWLEAQSEVLSVTANSAVVPSGGVRTGVNPSTVKQAFYYETGADRLAQRGYTGAGQTVAVIDTGITEVADLAGRIKPVPNPSVANGTATKCVNLTEETHCDDSYGHGTFVAGLIAGNGSKSDGKFVGAAPDAKLVSVKIAGRTGASDVSKVLAGIQYVVSFRQQLGIGVLNLSLGTDSDAPTETDPLNRAVQRAVQEGIAVVVAAGNMGLQGRNGGSAVFKPADDPLVLTVGAVDDRETPSRADDVTPRFTSRGPTAQGRAKPDVVAPGAHLVSLMSPGSYVETSAAGRGVVVDGLYRRGSGTSFAAGVVSGLAALVRQAQPGWTPTQVKDAFTATATPTGNGDVNAIGKGLVDAWAAVSAAPALRSVSVSTEVMSAIDRSRGSARTYVTNCTSWERRDHDYCTNGDNAPGMQGEVISRSNGQQLDAWNAADYLKTWDPKTWYESQWAVEPTSIVDDLVRKGHDWIGHDWIGHDWIGHDWIGHDWIGGADTGESYGAPRRGSAWYGTSE